ncbi:hypothetical protein Tco_1200618 [Tanacetum coccineum]
MPGGRKKAQTLEAKTPLNLPFRTSEVELRNCSPSRVCIYGGDNKMPVIIAKELDCLRKNPLLVKVLKSHKRALAWILSDIQGINPELCTTRILMEEDYAQHPHQRRVNPKNPRILIKKEVEKLLEAVLIYPISDSPWESSDQAMCARNEALRFTQHLSTMDPPWDIMVQTHSQKDLCSGFFTGPPSLKMPTEVCQELIAPDCEDSQFCHSQEFSHLQLPNGNAEILNLNKRKDNVISFGIPHKRP